VRDTRRHDQAVTCLELDAFVSQFDGEDTLDQVYRLVLVGVDVLGRAWGAGFDSSLANEETSVRSGAVRQDLPGGGDPVVQRVKLGSTTVRWSTVGPPSPIV
jgi:hypothetical protein